jgi:hypothetical protein
LRNKLAHSSYSNPKIDVSSSLPVLFSRVFGGFDSFYAVAAIFGRFDFAQYWALWSKGDVSGVSSCK